MVQINGMSRLNWWSQSKLYILATQNKWILFKFRFQKNFELYANNMGNYFTAEYYKP